GGARRQSVDHLLGRRRGAWGKVVVATVVRGDGVGTDSQCGDGNGRHAVAVEGGGAQGRRPVQERDGAGRGRGRPGDRGREGDGAENRGRVRARNHDRRGRVEVADGQQGGVVDGVDGPVRADQGGRIRLADAGRQGDRLGERVGREVPPVQPTV